MHVIDVDRNLLLVRSVEKFPCLYNFTLPDYIKKEMTDIAWTEVSNETKLTVAECKKNWKHLRFGLSRSLKPTIDGSVRKKYYLHDEMVFVLPFLKLFPRKIGGYVAPAIESGDTDEDNTETLEKSQSPHNTFFDLEVLQHKPPRKRISAEAVNNQLDNHTTERVECSRRMFLLSLLPEVNELTESQMRAFRRKVLYLIDEIMETPNQM